VVSSGKKCPPGKAFPDTGMAARACQVAFTSNVRPVLPRSDHNAIIGQAIFFARSASSCSRSIDAPAR